jgi:ELWxxDGT repeat protein
LWKSDGSAAGTKMVKDVRAGSRGSFPGDLINVSGTLFFTANDGSHGRELWRSNGTAAGTVMVKDLTNDELSGTNTSLYLPVAVGSRLFFFVANCCAGGSSLVVSDGTSAGTSRIEKPLEDVSSARALGTKLFFVQTDYSVDPPGQALWVSNGTAAGTHRFAPARSADEITILPASGNFLYFTAAVSGVGLRLWRTDGTASGTIALTTDGQLSDVPTAAIYMNHAIYFLEESDNSGISGLWKTNGTPAATELIKSGYFNELVAADGRLYFIDTGLWRSDGTTAGTKNLGEFGSVEPHNLTAVGSYVCFAETNFYVDWWRLWASGGTVATTHQVREWPNNAGMYVRVAIGTRLYFAANDGSRGNELWKYSP